MLAPHSIIRSMVSTPLAALILLLSWLAVRQDAAAVPVQRRHAIAVQKSPAFHKIAARKDGKHAPVPAQQKHRRTRAHRPTVVKIAVPQSFALPYVAEEYRAVKQTSLAGVYSYVFFREITPPPPKAC